MNKKKTTVGQYLIDRLTQIGIRHIFGIPGDYALKFFDLLVESPIEVVGTCNELNAGYAADAYARLNGVGAVCVTYGVGAFSLFNAVAGAYAERVPLIAICGGPRMSHRKEHDKLMHHVVGHSRLQQEAYSKITAVSMIIENPAEAPELIDSIINDCLLYKAPVFIELPADIVMAECDAPAKWKPDMTLPVDKGAMNEAVRRTVGLLQKARKPAILAGGAFSRLNMEDEFADFLEYTGYPASSIVNSKGMIPENLPNFVGTYCGKLLSGKARRIIEDADVLIVLGVLFSELNVGLFTAKLNEARMVYAQPMSVSIGRDNYEYVHIEQFVRRLKQELKQGECRLPWKDHPSHVLDKAYNPRRNAKLTSKRFWMRLNRFLEKGHFLITDSGSAILESAAMYLPDGVKMLAQDFYLSIGYSLPAAMGVKFARPGIRPVVVIGDGAFQMTCQELSTMIRNKLNPVVFVINNDGYQIERVIYDNTYNDIQPWKYHKLPEVFGGGLSFRVETEGELEDAVKTADENRGELIFIEVCVGRFDYPPTLERFGRLLR